MRTFLTSYKGTFSQSRDTARMSIWECLSNAGEILVGLNFASRGARPWGDHCVAEASLHLVGSEQVERQF